VRVGGHYVVQLRSFTVATFDTSRKTLVLFTNMKILVNNTNIKLLSLTKGCLYCMPLVNALILSNIVAYRHKSYVVKK